MQEAGKSGPLGRVCLAIQGGGKSYRPPPSVRLNISLWKVRWMFAVEMYARIRGACMTVITAPHISSTCKMGPSDIPLAVVDQRCRVHGLDELRKVDASIMPDTARSNLNLSVMALGGGPPTRSRGWGRTGAPDPTHTAASRHWGQRRCPGPRRWCRPAGFPP